MLLGDALVAGFTGAVIGGGVGSILVFILRDREVKQQILAARAKTEAEGRKLRRDLAATGEQIKSADEKSQRLTKLRELDFQRQRDTMVSRLLELQVEVERLRRPVPVDTELVRRADEADKLRERLTEERRGFQAERERLEAIERELRVMVRALEKMGAEMKGRVDDRDRALADQEQILERLEREKQAALEGQERAAREIGEFQQKAEIAEIELAAARDEASEHSARAAEARAANELARIEIEALRHQLAATQAELDTQRRASAAQPPPTARPATAEPPVESITIAPAPIAETVVPALCSTTSLRSLVGLGKAAERRFAELGIRTVGELLAARPDALATALGKRERGQLDSWLRQARELPPAPPAKKAGHRRVKTGGAAPVIRDGGD